MVGMPAWPARSSRHMVLPRDYLLLSVVALIFCGSTISAAAAGDVTAGRKIAHQHCARCHVIDEKNKFGGIGSTPSFKLLVTAFKDWRTRFKTFYARRPHPALITIEGRGRLREDLPPNAHPIELSSKAVDDILALAEDIRRSATKP